MQVLWCFLAFIFQLSYAVDLQKDYCIIGAGPSGLQMAFWLERAHRDYLIFEKASVPGSFFIQYPRHRKLISINKRYTGRTNKEFNLRHDWNSLLSDDESLLFKHYSDLYFPPADTLLKYLKDYQEKLGLKVQFNTEISDIKHRNVSMEDSCQYSMQDQNKKQYCCKVVIVGTGFGKTIVPEVKGGEHADRYDTVTVDPKDYEGQSVLIIGRGNSGLELALSIYGYANYVHLVSRERIRFSWDTHYVGDIRGVNNEIFDSYQLKSLDGVFEAGTEEMYIIKRKEDGKLMLRSVQYTELNFLDQNPVREGYDRIVLCTGFKWDDSIFHDSTKPMCSHLYAPKQKGHGKYPDIDYDFQSLQTPGLYFVGTITHSLDYRKSAGGFIHGFRYTTRTLHHLLEWKYEGKKWPSVEKPIDQLLPSILKRANEGSGIYQMFQFLGDIIILDRIAETFTYLEEFPVKLIPRLTEVTGHKFEAPRHALIVLNLEYGANFSRVGEDHFSEGRAHGSVSDAHRSNFLHPVIYYYRRLFTEMDLQMKGKYEVLPKPDGIHHIIEDFTTNFDGPTTHVLPFRRFLEFFLERDLRMFLAESCISFALTTHIEDPKEDLPLSCQRYFASEDSAFAFAA